jgi:enediyne biosynthesis protein E4
MGLNRPYVPTDSGMRKKVAHGNRLYFGAANGTFSGTPLSEQVARTGWSWGCAATDFDGDGFPDLYIANGHESRQSVRDYETEFWLHDIYVGNSRDNLFAQVYFKQRYAATRGQNWSYGGYEKNRFFLNDRGTNFVEVGWLFGVALEADSRNVVAADVTGDGKPDLILTTFEVHPRIRQTLKVFENRLDMRPSLTKAAAKIPRATGDSYRSQSPQSP